MAKKDWEKLAGERGERVKSSKFERVFKLGSVGAGVAASSLAGKLKSIVSGTDSEEDLSDLYRKNANRMADVLGQLKGASMKVGQMLSADPEALPPEFAEGLARLQRDAPPMTYNTVREEIEKAFDRPIYLVFRHFDPDLYDPKEWARQAKAAGMKYFVITTKHHDGFCLWNTKQTDYNATKTPHGKDLIASGTTEVNGEPVDSEADYLSENLILTVWPADEDGRLVGEDIWFGTMPNQKLARM